jgi:hypothetical protein
VSDFPRCQGITASGARCERLVSASQTHCYAHDASRAAQRKAIASKAAKSKSTETAAIKAELRQLANDVLANRVSPGKASVASQVLGQHLKYMEFDRKVFSDEELAKELAELREIVDRQSNRGVGRTWG